MLNLRSAWRDIAGGKHENAPSLDDSAVGKLREQIAECIEARGGEVSARSRAASIGQIYLGLKPEDRVRFLHVLAEDFDVDEEILDKTIAEYRKAVDVTGKLAAEVALRDVLVAPRVKLLTQFNALPQGVKFLVDMRADLLKLDLKNPHLAGLDRDMKDLLAAWFDVGFLDMKVISWESPAALLEKLIAYESVHEIRSWADLRNRLDRDRRCYGFFHPRMPDEPLIFVEVALVKGLSGSVQTLLDEAAPAHDPKQADTAIFYSISNTQDGLRGISFGSFLIKRVVDDLAADLPQVKTFSTLSPIPGFRRWLEAGLADPSALFPADDLAALAAADPRLADPAGLKPLLEGDGWQSEPSLTDALEKPLTRLCARYLTERRSGRALDPVARFHLGNGARVERINWLGDVSKKGLRESLGLMVNYLYRREDIEDNHEAFARDGTVAVSSGVADLLAAWKAAKENAPKVRVRGSRNPLRRIAS
ncbi:MAG: malonyl-CoA decarboxylase [Alphaproteobacteria bacterium]|nr:malonyl-CoA decarboxylase [Alphaproteobacteria bacterium]MBU0795916.1 malonyl-CoA decarboxylase [Alphaproteobacteria bacterium]MBU0886953.1 malonyl-CoA decarboxylase [Alphaproteobacteria bacterium]MBU1813191.1 malonyl-CoA decarboxylase [Alphaproteobacteria bacterium]